MADDEQRLRDMQREYLDFLDDEVNGNSFQFSKNILFEMGFLSFIYRKIKVPTWPWSRT